MQEYTRKKRKKRKTTLQAMSELKCAYTKKKWLKDIFLMVVDDSMPECCFHHNSKFEKSFFNCS